MQSQDLLEFDSRDDGVFVLKLRRSPSAGFVDLQLLREAEAVVETLSHADAPLLVVDFNHVEYFGSSTLEALCLIWGTVSQAGGKMVLANLSELGRQIIGIAKFDTVWPVVDTCEEGLAMAES